ncbi:MAG: FxDxF family PEP-CTERM protein [Duganella sp.]
MGATALCDGSDIDVAGASCIGFIDGNLNGNAPSIAEINLNLAVWGVNLTSAMPLTSMLSDLTGGTTINFSQMLYGDTIVGIHFGNVTDAFGTKSNNVTAFYRFDAGAGLDSFTTKFASLSNATLYSTDAAVTPVPEAETYAMMLAGLGLMGVVARRRKQK